MNSTQEPTKSNELNRASGNDGRLVYISEKRAFHAPALVKQGVLKQLTHGGKGGDESL